MAIMLRDKCHLFHINKFSRSLVNKSEKLGLGFYCFYISISLLIHDYYYY